MLHLRREIGTRQHLADHHRDGEGKPRSTEIGWHRRGCQPQLRETAQVFQHRLVHPHEAVLADDADRVDLGRSRGDLRGDVPAREVEHLAPGRHGPGHVGARAFHRADDARPGDHLVEDLDEIRIAGEEVRRAHRVKNGRRDRSDSVGASRSPRAAARRSSAVTIRCRWASAYRNGPPRNGGNPRPRTAPRSPSAGDRSPCSRASAGQRWRAALRSALRSRGQRRVTRQRWGTRRPSVAGTRKRRGRNPRPRARSRSWVRRYRALSRRSRRRARRPRGRPHRPAAAGRPASRTRSWRDRLPRWNRLRKAA